jgi:serine/threonine protein kinase
MNQNYINLEGGKKYGEGAKGYITDIFKPENDDDYFLKEFKKKKEQYKYKFIIYDPTEKKIKYQDQTYQNIFDLKDNKLKDFLIKVYNKSTIYNIEAKLVTQFIDDRLNDDYFTDDSGNIIIGIEKNDNKSLLKRKCQITLDKFRIYYTTNINEIKQFHKDKILNKIFSLRLAFGFILLNIIELQKKNYVHCDIKADNVMVCGDIIKIIDWDLAVKNNSYDKIEVCKLNYHGSATHQSPLITKFLYTSEICNNTNKAQQEIFIKLSKKSKIRHVPMSSNKITKNAEKHFKNINNLESLIRYHLDLYSISVILYELCGKKYAIDDIDDTDEAKTFFIKGIKEFIKILQNTIYVKSNDTSATEIIFTYFDDIDNNEKTINFCDLLNIFDENLYIIPKDLRDDFETAKATEAKEAEKAEKAKKKK